MYLYRFTVSLLVDLMTLTDGFSDLPSISSICPCWSRLGGETPAAGGDAAAARALFKDLTPSSGS